MILVILCMWGSFVLKPCEGKKKGGWISLSCSWLEVKIHLVYVVLYIDIGWFQIIQLQTCNIDIFYGHLVVLVPST